MSNIDEWIKQLEPLDRVSRRAVVHLIDAGTEAVFPLIQTLEKGNKMQKIQSARILGKIGDQRAIKPLGRMLDDPDYYLRSEAMTALYRLRAVELLVAHLIQAVQEIPTRTLWIIGELGDRRAIPPLQKELEKARPEHFIYYCRALAAIDPESLRPYLHHSQPRLRSAAIFAFLGPRPASDQLDLITAWFHDPDGDVRLQAVFYLGRIFSLPQVPIFLIEALNDDSKEVRIAAIQALGFWKGPEVITALIHRLHQDPDPAARRETTNTLRILSAHEAVPALIQALDDPDPYVRSNALSAVRWIEGPQALKPLLKWLAASSSDIYQELYLDMMGNLDNPYARYILLPEIRAGRMQFTEAPGKLEKIGEPETVLPLLDDLKAVDPEIRKKAIKTLSYIPQIHLQKYPILEILRPLQNDPERQVRSDLAGILASMDDPETLPILAHLMSDPDSMVRGGVVNGLRRHLRHAAVDLLIKALDDDAPYVYDSAAIALGLLRDPRAVDPLIRLLLKPNRPRNFEAALALKRIGDPRAVPPLLETLRNGALTHVRADLYAARALEKFRDPRIVPALLDALHEAGCNDDWACIKALSNALGHFKDPRALPPLLRLLDEEGLAADVIYALGRLGDERAVEPLLNKLPRAPRGIYQAVIIALSWMGDPRAFEALTEARQDPAADLQRAALRGLARIGDPRSLPAFLEALQTAPYSLRRFAVAGLIKIGAPAVEPLIALLQSEASPVIRARAAGVLGHIGDPRAVESLRTALYDPDRHVRIRARHALRQMSIP